MTTGQPGARWTLEQLPAAVADPVRRFCAETGTPERNIVLWDTGDYGVFVSTSERFFANLAMKRLNACRYLERRGDGVRRRRRQRPDAGDMLALLWDGLAGATGDPAVLDVGGYVGRFAIECAFMLRARGLPGPVHCFEPGYTVPLIEANLALNGLADQVRVHPVALSHRSATMTYRVRNGVMISGRLSDLPDADSSMAVETLTGVDFLRARGIEGPLVVKVDTEGFEPQVVDGFLDHPGFPASVFIVELWPAALSVRMRTGETFAEFVHDRFQVVDIRNSLYPKFSGMVPDLSRFAASFDFRKGNVDLLLIPRALADEPLLRALRETLQ